jgi:hypothetical protein
MAEPRNLQRIPPPNLNKFMSQKAVPRGGFFMS